MLENTKEHTNNNETGSNVENLTRGHPKKVKNNKKNIAVMEFKRIKPGTSRKVTNNLRRKRPGTTCKTGPVKRQKRADNVGNLYRGKLSNIVFRRCCASSVSSQSVRSWSST